MLSTESSDQWLCLRKSLQRKLLAWQLAKFLHFKGTCEGINSELFYCYGFIYSDHRPHSPVIFWLFSPCWDFSSMESVGLHTLILLSVDSNRARGVRERFCIRGQWAWNRLPRAVVVALSLSEFKIHLDNTLSHVVWFLGGAVEYRVGLHDPCVSIATWDSQWFCDWTILVILNILGGLFFNI